MSATLAYVAHRLVWAVVLVAGVVSLSFVLLDTLPGDPARMLVGPQASAKDVAQAREVLGLDRPLPERFVRYWSRLAHRASSDGDHRSCATFGPAHVDLGFSFHYRKPVVDLLRDRLPRSIELGLAALFVQLLLGVGIGVVAATRRGGTFDDAAVGAALVGTSAPTFLLGAVLQYVLAYEVRLLPFDGYGRTPSEHLASLVLPALTLGIFGTALYVRLVRQEMTSLLALDHVRTARAKGASSVRVVLVHGLRNALVPIATLATLDLGALVAGAIVTERLFRWPGVGQMAVEGVLNRDGPVVLATVLVAGVAVVLTTFVLDLSYTALDPRIRRPSRPHDG